MKLLAAILVFLLAVPPVQGGFCDMGGMDTADSAGRHASMHHGADADDSGHDRARNEGAGHACCAPAGQRGQPDSGSGCADMPCGSCSLGVQAVPFATPLAMPLPTSRHVILSEGRL
ncbi:MAG: hypothetical protein R3233_04105, partial [Xanthomonadales bacterium]|nr:hypothetical protein [Xanthomonadales bacterium]